MNKKFLSFFFMVSLLISACSNPNEENTVSESAPSTIETEELAEKYVNEEIGETIETEEGQRTVVKTLYDLNETQESGPFKITIRDVRLSQFQPTPEKVMEYGGDDLGIISIHLLVENTSDETALIYPTQGTIKTDTGKKVDMHFSLSHEVGGEFKGRTAKAGEVYCLFVGQAADVSKVTYHIEAAHDKEVQPLGDDFNFSFTFN